MIKIITDPFENVNDLNEITSLTYNFRQHFLINTPNETKDDIREELNQLQTKYKFVLFRAYNKSNLTGYLLLFTNTPKFGIPWDWNPIIFPADNEDSIAMQLIEKMIDHSRKNQISRIEVGFTIENEYHRKLHNIQLKWFESLNFSLLTEEYSMEKNLQENSLEDKELPEEYEVVPLINANVKLLPQIAYDVFNNSEDSMFLSLNEEEKRIMCSKYFDLKEPIIQDASFILKRKENIIGFSITRAHNKDADLNSLGIIHQERNKGLAELLLWITLQKLHEKGFDKIYLDVVAENKPAFALYHKLGFSIMSSTLIYALNC